MHSFSKKELFLMAGLLALLIPALIINLGIVPLYAEEPRRAVVALEMLLRGNWLVPTINGEFYYLKPPVYNWILASIYQLTGDPSEFYTRVTTVVSMLLLGMVIYWSGRKYVSVSFGALTSLLFVTISGNLFFNSLLAEIDLFYSLVTYTGLIGLFHFHQNKQYFRLFLLVYLLGAVGFLTKGMPSLLFTGLSLLAYLLVKKDLRKLFTLPHLAGISLFILLVGGYFLAYSKEGNVLKYLMNLTFESSKRFSGDTALDFIKHMLLYPLDTLWNLIPASFLVVFTFRRSFLKVVRENPFISFALLMLIVHFPIYWLPPGGRQRYIIMLYPFIIQVMAYFYLRFIDNETRLARIFHRALAVMTMLMAAISLVPLFLDDLKDIHYLLVFCLAAMLAFLLICILQWRYPRSAVIGMMFALVIARLLFNQLVLPIRAGDGGAFENKQMALKIAEAVGSGDVGILPGTNFPMQAIYYLERDRIKVLPVHRESKPGSFHIMEKAMLDKYRVYRDEDESSNLFRRKFSDPYSGDDQEFLQGQSYNMVFDLLVKRKRNLYSHFLLIHVPDK